MPFPVPYIPTGPKYNNCSIYYIIIMIFSYISCYLLIYILILALVSGAVYSKWSQLLIFSYISCYLPIYLDICSGTFLFTYILIIICLLYNVIFRYFDIWQAPHTWTGEILLVWYGTWLLLHGAVLDITLKICRQLGFHPLNDHTHKLEWLVPLNAPIHFIHTPGNKILLTWW